MDGWRRFFLLMGSAIAKLERRPLCPDCPMDDRELKSELHALVDQLRVAQCFEVGQTQFGICPPAARAGLKCFC
jgi:hypothetical protein